MSHHRLLWSFWTGNSLRELCGLWSSNTKNQTFSLPTLLRFTIENQLSLWRAVCLEGIVGGSEKGHPSLYVPALKRSLKYTHTYTHASTHIYTCSHESNHTSTPWRPPVSPMWLMVLGADYCDHGGNQENSQELLSILIHPPRSVRHVSVMNRWITVCWEIYGGDIDHPN